MLCGCSATSRRSVWPRSSAILLVERNARLALRFADRAYVLQVGRVALSGASADLLADDQLNAAYLGG